MHLADPSAFFIDGADFSRQDEPGRSKAAAHLVRQAEFFLQTVKTFFRRDQLFSQFCSPGPKSCMPLRRAQKSRWGRSQSRLVAREYFEWMCRSAIYKILSSPDDDKVYYTVFPEKCQRKKEKSCKKIDFFAGS